MTREIDNFFPGLFVYHNIRVFDEEATDLLAYWNDTFKFISKAKYGLFISSTNFGEVGVVEKKYASIYNFPCPTNLSYVPYSGL